jgi:hypothetical protein
MVPPIEHRRQEMVDFEVFCNIRRRLAAAPAIGQRLNDPLTVRNGEGDRIHPHPFIEHFAKRP